ncbi:MAG: hypothetical protein DLM58_06745 [Pseudonocardiales bacterium]|nr:MAG: hypothetical protein DLM58_06745 [Pseudonocardiales bacterium]
MTSVHQPHRPTRPRPPAAIAGDRSRGSPAAPTIEGADPGVAGNDRVTSATGLVLSVLLLIEGATVLDVRGMITLHLYVGLLLLGPITLKIAATIYRFARYYQHSTPYVRRGPPHLALRLLGPPLILATITLMISGVGLVYTNPAHPGFWLNLHQVSFVIWVALIGIHVLAHLRHTLTQSWRELRPAPGDTAARRRTARVLTLAIALAAGIATACALMPAASAWR